MYNNYQNCILLKKDVILDNFKQTAASVIVC